MNILSAFSEHEPSNELSITQEQSFDVGEARKFLNAIGVLKGSLIHYLAYPPKKKDRPDLYVNGNKLQGKPYQSCYPDLPIDAAKWQHDHLANGYGFGLVINIGGTTKASIQKCRAIFTETDSGISKEEQLKNLKRLTLPPTIIVDSGNKSLHAYWVCEEFLEVTEWQPLQKVLASLYLDADKSLLDPNQVMRLPGTIHPKTREFCKVLEIGESYSKGALTSAFSMPESSPVDSDQNVIRLTFPSQYSISSELLDLLKDAKLDLEMLVSHGIQDDIQMIRNLAQTELTEDEIKAGIDRSELATKIAKEFQGWQNWFDDIGFKYDLKPKEKWLEIVYELIDDESRLDRIWNSFDHDECETAIALEKTQVYITWTVIRKAINAVNGSLKKDLGDYQPYLYIQRNFSEIFACELESCRMFDDEFHFWDGSHWKPVDDNGQVIKKVQDFLSKIYDVKIVKAKKGEKEIIIIKQPFGSARQVQECVESLKNDRYI